MLKIFSSKQKKRQPPAPNPSEAINRIRNIEEMLNKKQDYLESKIQTEMAIIRKNGTKNKKISMQALKRKKRLDGQLQQIDGTLTTLESQRISLENANTNVQVLQSMKYGADALKQAHTRIGDVDNVQDVMDDIREQQELAQEIGDLISNPLGFGGQDIGDDDDELLRELEDLEQQDLDEQLLSTDGLPSVPSTSLQKPSSSVSSSSRKTVANDDMNKTLKQLADWAV
ncbi:charged multivesicular body protein 4c-like [Oppia nitens]|uniref:charged multivesicular body protein 4c-like n=1 Tax=Oppia nitens TaxID=1686743 RepID=UPI0023D99FE1|nr:charged multivesicular body protein 4c-like [Oppia nitens]